MHDQTRRPSPRANQTQQTPTYTNKDICTHTTTNQRKPLNQKTQMTPKEDNFRSKCRDLRCATTVQQWSLDVRNNGSILGTSLCHVVKCPGISGEHAELYPKCLLHRLLQKSPLFPIKAPASRSMRALPLPPRMTFPSQGSQIARIVQGLVLKEIQISLEMHAWLLGLVGFAAWSVLLKPDDVVPALCCFLQFPIQVKRCRLSPTLLLLCSCYPELG